MNYEQMSLAELREAAKERGMKGVSALRKHDLMEAIKAYDARKTLTEPEEKKEAPSDVPVPISAVETAPIIGQEPRIYRRPIQSPEGRTPLQQQSAGQRPVIRRAPRTAGGDEVRERTPYRPSEGQAARPVRRTGTGAPVAREGVRDDAPVREGGIRRVVRPVPSAPVRSERSDAGGERPGDRTYGERTYGERIYGQRTARPERAESPRENRAELRSEARTDARADQRGEGRNDARSDYRGEPRSDYRPVRQERYRQEEELPMPAEIESLDSGEMKEGILEVNPDGFGFLRCDNYLPGENDVYVSPAQIRRFNLKTGDIVLGNTRVKSATEKFSALLYIQKINGMDPSEAASRCKFEEMTPIFPQERIRLEKPGCPVSMRMMDLISPIGKGQRGMIVAPPKVGKTTLLKQVAASVAANHPEMHLIVLLIDERPEEVTDIKESIEGPNAEVIYSTFDEQPENHKRVTEMVLERAKRLVEHKQDVIILLDSITRLARAYNLTVTPSGRTLSGGLDPAALYMPKKFFGAARNMREGGSLTILATALVDTGSRMDDMVFEEFKGTGNMEIVLNRNLSEHRVFPAIDLYKSGTRREDLLLSPEEAACADKVRRILAGGRPDQALEHIIDLFERTASNQEFVAAVSRIRISD
ncbi:MAG: transcription termination factor Rho [Lachnospiraceae bacterium]|nr:transcription termination factor Rho [Lachnospiraceae bacterium]MBR0152196.1 transcription termination factor Rho [Lachnospiraceae bacterium]